MILAVSQITFFCVVHIFAQCVKVCTAHELVFFAVYLGEKKYTVCELKQGCLEYDII